jgi:hypothetical protein
MAPIAAILVEKKKDDRPRRESDRRPSFVSEGRMVH